jgi:4-diphosphocytidyl-2-C-methyl-D-erythritol kinase
LRLTNGRTDDIIPRFYGNVADLCAILANDLETVTITRFPVIQEIKERLVACGARGALMSGSGPTVFGVFEDEAAARCCVAELGREAAWFTTAVKTL